MAACHNIKLALIFCLISGAFSQAIFEGGEDCTGIPQCNTNPCDDATCPNRRDARCKILIDNCGRCRAVFFVATGDLTNEDCFGGSSCQLCKPDPCASASCPLLPEATCSSDTCKRCTAEFSLGGAVLTEADCHLGSGPATPCPDGSPQVRCKDPCADVSCPAEPEAKCRADLCGGCSAHFYVEDRRISDLLCLGIVPCPPDTPQAGCMQRPGQRCMGQTCPAVPDAKCIIDGCGGCNVIFYKGGRRLTKEDCEGCPPRNCDPCEGAKCPDYVGARCERRRCGQCKAVFYGADRKEIGTCCKSERCEDGSIKFHCKKDPCDGATCVAFPGATCRSNTCGGCKAEFFLSNENKLSDLDCIPFQYCPPNVPTAKCLADNCLGETCPNYPGAQCKIDGCNGCKAIFYYHGKRLTNEDCNGCPNGDRVPGCRNPCDGAVCARNRGARCEPQVCGECKARFFGLDRQEITTCGTGPCPGGNRFDCVIDPCEVNTCPGVKDAECRANNCGGCKAEFYYKDSDRRIPDFMCAEREPCPGDLPVAGCQIQCSGGCPNFPNAECFIDGCSGCNVIYYDGSRRLTDEDCNGCPPGLTIAENCVNPCENALCPLYPGARCEARRCGTCRTVFFEPGYKEIDNCCGGPAISLCPGNKVRVPCSIPCIDSCEIQHDSCIEICDTNINCVCPDGYVEETTGSDTCIPREDCPRPCGNGKEPINCGVVPLCSRPSCPLYPSAVCKSTNCGECREWYEDEQGNEVDCEEPSCLGNKIYVSCSVPCIDSCEVQHDGCIEICDSSINCICPTGLVEETSGSNNCIPKSSCPVIDPCPHDAPLVSCALDPCDSATCPGNPNAVCVLNYCGGCSAEFFVGTRKLTDFECVKNPDDCAAFTTCASDVCNCPVQPDAQCVVQYCPPNTCKPLYFDKNGKSISYQDCGLCEDGSEHVNCGIVPPCMFATCPAHPDAQCRVNNCGTCRTYFVDSSGKTVECEKKVTCKVPDSFAHGVVSPNDRSVINTGEIVIYRCDNGFRMHGGSRRRCVERRGKGRLTGNPPRCFDKLCPSVVDRASTCRSECNTNGECGFDRMCCWNGCTSTCVRKPSICPGGIPLVQCFSDPCQFSSCPRYPTATCKANYCGGCLTDWYVGNKKLQADDCARPADARCPPLSLAIPLCIDLCTKDSDCNILEVCCFNGCGHRCLGY